MKAQGLPINFIVLAALAILILILAAAFAIGGFGTFKRALSPEAARQQCNTWCSEVQTDAAVGL